MGFSKIRIRNKKSNPYIALTTLVWKGRFYMSKRSEIVRIAGEQIGQVGGEPYWRWYGFSYRIEWCACFVSWCAAQVGALDVCIKKSISCTEQSNWFKARSQWQNRYYVPAVGDIIYYDWTPDNSDTTPDHVGMVEMVNGNTITVIEGNRDDECSRRTVSVGWYLIYGYGVPDYGNESGQAPAPTPPSGETYSNANMVGEYGAHPNTKNYSLEYDSKVAQLQQLLNEHDGTTLQVNGKADESTYIALNGHEVHLGYRDWFVKWVQERLNMVGFDCGEVDGFAEQPTMDGIAEFQRHYGLGVGYLGGTDRYYLIEM